MASDWETVCNAIRDDLIGNVAGLGAADVKSSNIHMYEPWDPEELIADGSRHLAVWPIGEAQGAADEREPLATGAHQLNQTYVVTVWEGSKSESTRLKRDEAAAKTWLELHNAIRSRLYVTANQMLGGSPLVWYRGAELPERASRVRYVRIFVTVARLQEFS